MLKADATTTAVRSAEGRGATVDDAVASALAELGARADETVVDVLSGGGSPIAGERLTGAEARVRVTVVDERTARARDLLTELLDAMRIPSRVNVRAATLPAGVDGESSGAMVLDVNGDDLGLLIGWRGETLRAVQTVVNLMMGEDDPEKHRIIIDVERYRARREEAVRDLALRLAQRVKRSGERYTLDPMQPYERRVVHLTLANDEGVRTESTGREPARRILIHPTGPPQPQLPDLDGGRRRGGPWRGRR